MKAFMKENDHIRNGKHREIYWGESYRTDPTKLTTVLHQPIKKN
jgi:hypothetical protein